MPGVSPVSSRPAIEAAAAPRAAEHLLPSTLTVASKGGGPLQLRCHDCSDYGPHQRPLLSHTSTDTHADATTVLSLQPHQAVASQVAGGPVNLCPRVRQGKMNSAKTETRNAASPAQSPNLRSPSMKRFTLPTHPAPDSNPARLHGVLPRHLV